MSLIIRADDQVDIPERLPVVALRDLVFFPYIVLPILIGRRRSVAALEEARDTNSLVVLVAQKDPGVDDPGAPTPTVYIIRNAKFDPDHHTVKPKVIPIAARAVMTLVKAQGLGDVYRLHAVCRRDELEFRLAWIPGDLTLPRATKICRSRAT